MIAFILSLISVVILLFNYEFAFILGIVSIVVAIINRKKKSKLTIPAIIISSIVLLISIICFCSEAVKVTNIFNETNKEVDRIAEKYKNE